MFDLRRLFTRAAARSCALVVMFSALVAVPPAANAATKLRLYWDGLSIVTGKTVSIAMPDGAVVTGKATRQEADALLLDVKKTTDRRAYPKGLLRVPRATLRVLQMQTNGKLGRIAGTLLGTLAGGIIGGYAALGIDGLWNETSAGGATAAIGFTAAGFAGGYLAGSAIDRHWTTIEIAP
jgi:hypothetical protein